MSTSRFTISQQKTLACLPKITGFLSMLGSGFIILEVLRDRKKIGQIYHRLMLGMAALDFLSSFFMALSTWCAPVESGLVFASGTRASCQTQAFFVMLSVSVPAYNVALAVYYLQVIGYSKRERHLRTYERIMHCLVLCFGLGVSIAGVALDLFHPSWLWCTIAPNRSGGVDNYSHWYIWGFFGIPLWIFIFTITLIMIWVVVLVKRQEKKVRKWRHGSDSVAKRLSRQVVHQAFWYSVSFYVTWTVPTISRVLHAVHGSVPFGVLAAQAFLLPCQGLINCLVYIRPRYERYKRNHPRSSIFILTGLTIGKTLKFWRREAEDDAKDDMNPAFDIGMLNTTASNVHESRFDHLRSALPKTSRSVSKPQNSSCVAPGSMGEKSKEAPPTSEAAPLPPRVESSGEFKEEIS